MDIRATSLQLLRILPTGREKMSGTPRTSRLDFVSILVLVLQWWGWVRIGGLMETGEDLP